MFKSYVKNIECGQRQLDKMKRPFTLPEAKRLDFCNQSQPLGFKASTYSKIVAVPFMKRAISVRTYRCEADVQLLVHTAAAEQLSTAGQQAHQVFGTAEVRERHGTVRETV